MDQLALEFGTGMERVYSLAAMFAVALMVATAGLGLWLGDLHGQIDPAVLRWGTVHRLSGVLAALMVVLVNSISVTYFIGTGRWCREVVETYALAPALIERSRRIKRAAFPASLLGMLAVVAIVALGGAADLLPEVEFHSHDRLLLSAALALGITIAWGITVVERSSHSHRGHGGSVPLTPHRDPGPAAPPALPRAPLR